MSIGITENHILYDNIYAPIIKFSYSNYIDDEEDMINDQTSSNILNDNLFNIENSFKTFSLEDLIKSFDNTINTCFSNSQIIQSNEESIHPSQIDLLTTSSNTWSKLIDNLHTSLYNDLKLSHIKKNCQIAMNNIYENNFQLIDDINEDEEELREQLDMHSVIISSNNFISEPFLTAEQVINEIDFMLQYITPDSGYYDDLHINHNEFYLKNQTIYSLNYLYEQLNTSIKDLSSILVKELAIRDELEYNKEVKNTFISLVLSIQNKRRLYQNKKRHSILANNKDCIEPGTYLTTVIPYNREHSTYLSVEYLQSLNKILHAINEDSPQVPELLTNYILKVLCPCK